jgi:acetyl esterase/lipase
MASSLVNTFLRRLTGRSRRPGWPLLFEVAVGTLRRNLIYSAGLPIGEARRFNDACAQSQPIKQPIERRKETIAGVEVERFTPRGAAPKSAVLYLHGGSYLMGSVATHADLIARLAVLGPFEVIGVEYRLAPEHTIADAVADVCAVYRAQLAEGRAPSAIALAGDSAGGGLAFLTSVALRDAGDALPSSIATIAPWGDLQSEGASFALNEPYDWGTAAILRQQAKIAAGGVALDDPSISPRFADLRGLPPSLLHLGDAEIVRDSALELAEALRAAGVDVTCKVWPDMVHDFHLLADYHPMARQAVEELVAFVRDHFGEAPKPHP